MKVHNYRSKHYLNKNRTSFLCGVGTMPALFVLLFVLYCSFVVTGIAGAGSECDTLIVYYSRTGGCKEVADTLKKHIRADILEVTDTKDRSGSSGFFWAAFDSFFDRYTHIQPERFSFSAYSKIIFVSPLWYWKLSVPIRTLIHENRFDGKDLIFFTTGNIEVTKYAELGDDAPFIKRYLRDYLQNKCDTMKTFVQSSGGNITGYYHVATKERSVGDIQKDILKHTLNIQSEIQNHVKSSIQKQLWSDPIKNVLL